jgi:hypothetical protein
VEAKLKVPRPSGYDFLEDTPSSLDDLFHGKSQSNSWMMFLGVPPRLGKPPLIGNISEYGM